jgi:hypothetical protein
MLYKSILILTPIQRWNAAKGLNRNSGNSIAENWSALTSSERSFVIGGIIAVILLTIAFFLLGLRRKMLEQKESEKLFAEYAEKRGLTLLECQILIEIARKAGLKRSESIFTLAAAFDLGTEELRKKLVARQTTEENHQLEAVLSSLREKLGFTKEASFSRGSTIKSETSSRQIPLNKIIYMTSQKTMDLEPIEATVVKNSDTELAVRLARPATITFGEYWNVRYYAGSSIWEFDAYVISYDGNIMILSHSDNIRFINRRRFLRASVQKPAFIALFPFERTLTHRFESRMENGEMTQDLPDVSLKPLQFVPALVTELGGPGLRIEAPVNVEVGDRVLIIFELSREKDQDLIKDQQDNMIATTTTVLRIIEGIGIVEEIGIIKRAEYGPENMSMAIELTGLRDSDVDCLIRATNAASLNVSDQNKNMSSLENTVGNPPVQTGV